MIETLNIKDYKEELWGQAYGLDCDNIVITTSENKKIKRKLTVNGINLYDTLATYYSKDGLYLLRYSVATKIQLFSGKELKREVIL